MSKLPSVTPRQVVAALKRAGFHEVRQKGSHLFLYHPGTLRRTTVAMHGGAVRRGTLGAILKQAGLTDDEFTRLL